MPCGGSAAAYLIKHATAMPISTAHMNTWHVRLKAKWCIELRKGEMAKNERQHGQVQLNNPSHQVLSGVGACAHVVLVGAGHSCPMHMTAP